MPRRSGTDVLFPKWTRPAVFSAGRVCFSDPVFFVPVCGASLLSPCAVPLFRFVPRCHPRPASVAVPVCAVSPLSPCAVPLFRPVPCRHPRPASVAVPVCALSPLRFASHCHPLSASCRRSGLRMAAAGEFCGRFGGESVRTAGLLRPFPALRRFRSGRPPAFL